MKIENLKLKIGRFMLKDLRFKMKSFRFIVVMMLLLPMMVCAQPDQPSPFKGHLVGERPMDLSRPEKQATFSGGASANGLMNTGSTYSSTVVSEYNPGGFGSSSTGAPTGPRRVGENDGDDEIPMPDPIGDGVWVLLICACAYIIVRVVRKRTRA